MNAITQWWQTGDLGQIDTSVSIDRKSIIILALVTIVVAGIIILMAKYAKSK